MVGMDLSGKSALVTGASQGLGRAIALRLSQAGARVAVNYLDDAAGMNRLAAEQVVAELSGEGLPLAADVRDRGQVAAMMAAAAASWGSLDIVVNNAGILRDKTLRKMSEEEWQDVIATNLSGVFHVCQAALSHLSDGGRIISISSVAAQCGFFGQANYAAAKAGIVALTKVLSKEVASRRITVNAVAPGIMLTDMGCSIPEAKRAELLRQVPLGRFPELDEIANGVLFLASDLASYMTGQTLHINGGWFGTG